MEQTKQRDERGRFIKDPQKPETVTIEATEYQKLKAADHARQMAVDEASYTIATMEDEIRTKTIGFVVAVVAFLVTVAALVFVIAN